MREDKVHKIEVHVAGICFNDDKVLVLKRTPSRKLYPNFWECGGGQVEAGESFEEAVKRQLKEEVGVIIKPLGIFNTYEIVKQDIEQRKIPGLYFACKIVGFANKKDPIISSEHSEWKWQPVDKLDELEFIPGLKDNIKSAYFIYRKNKLNLK